MSRKPPTVKHLPLCIDHRYHCQLSPFISASAPQCVNLAYVVLHPLLQVRLHGIRGIESNCSSSIYMHVKQETHLRLTEAVKQTERKRGRHLEEGGVKSVKAEGISAVASQQSSGI